MYNRYIPQPDGSFQKSRHEDRLQENLPHPVSPEPPVCPEPQKQEEGKQPPKPAPPAHIRQNRPCRSVPPKKDRQEPPGIGIGSFFRQLIPKDLDTGDLIVILLLLLMSSDCQDDQNTALLTLALYLFL